MINPPMSSVEKHWVPYQKKSGIPPDSKNAWFDSRIIIFIME